MAELGERQAAILRAVIREFIRSGEPVGSRHLLERAKLQVSSATVRNDMARLEELGYLAQPHTSAGRVPTDRGYRFVVDQIKTPRPLAEGQQRALAEELGEGEPADVDELLRRASEVVSRFTRHASAVLARRARPSRVRRLELFASGPRVATAVLIAENGRVEQRIIPLDDDELTHDQIEQLGRQISRRVEGQPLDDAAQTIGDAARTGPPRERALLEGAAAAFAALLAADEHVFVGGVANLAGEETFEREQLSRLTEALEHQKAVLQLLASALGEAKPVAVRIGSELPSDDFRLCSVVVASFGSSVADGGSVGVIGPMRMDYDRVIATANAVARMLESSLGGEPA